MYAGIQAASGQTGFMHMPHFGANPHFAPHPPPHPLHHRDTNAGDATSRAGTSEPAPLTVSLHRNDPSQPWGFRIQGGKDYRMKLIVKKVGENSPAFTCLEAGDGIEMIGNKPSRDLTHAQAHELVKNAGNTLQMTITRGTGMANIGGADACGLANIKPEGPIKFSSAKAHKMRR